MLIMSNHFHLALELGEPNLSRGMQWLQGTWIRRYNAYRRIIGRPFQGRYKAILLETGAILGRVCHYIHLNPVRARLVTPENAREYPWSSLPRFLAGPRPVWLCPTVALASAGGLADTPAGWQQYLEHLVFLATDQDARKHLVADELSRGWCIGSEQFKGEIRDEHALRGAELDRFAGLEPEAVRAERQAAWKEQLVAYAHSAGIDLASLPAAKSHPHKALLAAAMKQTASVSNQWLARQLAMGKPASASQFARRFRLTPAGAARLQSLLSTVKT